MAEDFYQDLVEKFCQGDIFEVLPHALVTGPLEQVPETTDHLVTECKRDKAILITYDCQIDKPNLKSWLVCPVLRLDRMEKATQANIKKNRIYSFLHLAEYRDILPASFVDFDHITSLQPELVKSAKRLVSLSDIGRRALYSQFIRSLTRWELGDLKCPTCAVEFNPIDFLPVRPD